ncbi:MAG: LacI family DNA-binding transcriptional regulator [Christensenellales bacterium]
MKILKDIAREAGVSITTVHNVINSKPNRVSPELVTRIQEIIRRENYVPSMTARTLARSASSIIGVINHIVSPRSGGFMADPFHNIFIGSIEACTRDKGYFVMVRTIEDTLGLETICHIWNLAGIILAGMFRDEFFATVQRIGIPYVLIDSYVDSPEVCNVGLEDQKGGYLATRHLLEHGHRAIAFASPAIRENGVIQKRLLGYRQALAEFGVPFDDSRIFVQGISVTDGVKLGRQLAARKELTGIFASADSLAAGIIAGLRDEGVPVPLEKSIVGFDDNYFCQITNPRLTTIHQDIEKKGILATEMMIAQLLGQPIPQRQIVLPVSLVERESVRHIP